MNTRPYQMHWSDQEMGNAISCPKHSKMAALIQMVSSSYTVSSCSCLSFKDPSDHDCHMHAGHPYYFRAQV